jgi:hypothetical protein
MENFEPPSSTKSAVYKWHEEINEYTMKLQQFNSDSQNKARKAIEDGNKQVINRVEIVLVI